MGRIRLLVLGVNWPCETFLQRKLLGLARLGFDITVAGVRHAATGDPHPNIRLASIATGTGPVAARLARLTGQTLLLAFVQPRRLWRTFYALLRLWTVDTAVLVSTMERFVAAARLDADVIHFEWNASAIEYLPLYDVWRRPVVVSCRGQQLNVVPHIPGAADYIVKLRESFARAAAVHCVSRAIREEAAVHGLDRAKAVIITPAVDPSVFTAVQRGHADSIVRLLAVGSLSWAKGYEYALVALRRLIDDGLPVALEIVGSGPDVERIAFTLRDLRLEDHVTMYGVVSAATVVERMHAADVFLHSSVSEGISNAVLEAMASALPVVTTDCGGMREAVEDGVEGFVVSPRDPASLARAISTLAKDSALRRTMGQAGRARIERSFQLANQLDAFRALYERLALAAT